MRNFLIGASMLAMLAACGGEDEPSAKTESTVAQATLQPFKAKDYGQTSEALAALNLAESGAGLIKFDSSKTADGGAIFKNVVIDSEDGEGKLIAETLSFDGLQLTDAGPMFDRMILSNASLEFPQEDDTTGSFTISEISVVEPNQQAAAFFTALVQGEDLPKDVKFSEWAFDQMALKGLALDVVSTEEGDAGHVKMSLNELSMTSLAEALAGGTLLSGLKMDLDLPQSADLDFPLKGSLNLDEMSFGNLQMQLVDAAIAAEGDPQEIMALNTKLVESYTSPIEQGFDNSVLKGLSLDLSGISFSMSEAVTKVERNKDGVATRVSQPKTTLKFATDAEGGQLGAQAATFLGMMGYESLELSGNAETTYDPETKETRYDAYTLDIKDALKLDMKGGIFNLLDVLKVAANSESGQPDFAALQQVALGDIEIAIEDKSFMERAFKLAAQQQGVEPEMLRSMATGGLAIATLGAAEQGIDPNLVNTAVGALTTFIEQGGTLTLAINPEEPLVFSEIEDPSVLTVEKLGFTASTK